MSLFDQFLILVAVICTFSGCASVSMDRAVETETASAISQSEYSDSDGEEGGTIYFEYDKYNLSNSAISDIRSLAKTIKSSGANVRIEGHCDERGTREYNLALGEKRANEVAEMLQVNGVSSTKITTVSYGEERPAANGSNEASWSKNRRAVIKIL